jgi:DNA-binding NarL/FixJ family response regulator
VIRVLIAAHSAMTRAGLETLVASAPGLQLAGSFPDASAAEALHPDVLLAAGALEDLPPPAARQPAIVLLSAESQPSFTHEAFKLGVRAVLARDASPGAILAAVEAAAGGLAVIEPGELEPLLAASSPAPASAASVALTARELDVLRLIARGMRNKEIAAQLGIGEETTQGHVKNILSKLGLHDRTEAVAVAVRRGIVHID